MVPDKLFLTITANGFIDKGMWMKKALDTRRQFMWDVKHQLEVLFWFADLNLSPRPVWAKIQEKFLPAIKKFKESL